MIALLIQDCETALEEEEFVTACSTEGSTLPMIYFEVRELPDEETPTPAYLNWTAQRISEIQRSAESQLDVMDDADDTLGAPFVGSVYVRLPNARCVIARDR